MTKFLDLDGFSLWVVYLGIFYSVSFSFSLENGYLNEEAVARRSFNKISHKNTTK